MLLHGELGVHLCGRIAERSSRSLDGDRAEPARRERERCLVRGGDGAPALVADADSGDAERDRFRVVEVARRHELVVVVLPDRAPGTIAGRDLAAEAAVNYGLVRPLAPS